MPAGASCAVWERWVTTSCWLNHLRNKWITLLFEQNLGHFSSESCRSSTKPLASASGLSRTMAISSSPPSFWMRAGRPACICARITTALFSHRVRSHSSRALCAKVPVCGGTFWATGVTNARMKRLSGSVEDGRSATAATARRMSPSLTS